MHLRPGGAIEQAVNTQVDNRNRAQAATPPQPETEEAFTARMKLRNKFNERSRDQGYEI